MHFYDKYVQNYGTATKPRKFDFIAWITREISKILPRIFIVPAYNMLKCHFPLSEKTIATVNRDSLWFWKYFIWLIHWILPCVNGLFLCVDIVILKILVGIIHFNRYEKNSFWNQLQKTRKFRPLIQRPEQLICTKIFYNLKVTQISRMVNYCTLIPECYHKKH